MKTARNPAALKQLLTSVISKTPSQRGSGRPDGLSGMIDALEQAKARFKAEKNMPSIPFVAKPRTQLLTSFELNRQQVLGQENGTYAFAKQTIIGTEIHVSQTRLEDLERGGS